MKLCIKKIYCPKCRKAVKGVEPPHDGPYRILCSKCGFAICVSNGIYWRRGLESESRPASEAEGKPAGKAKKTRVPRAKSVRKLSTDTAKET